MPKKKAVKPIRIACEGAATLPLDDLEVFQGDLKTLSEENAARLRRVILRDGFSEPFSVWRHDGHHYILNGTQRRRELGHMSSDGYKIPPLPVSWVEADSYEQAKLKVLDLTSQYGEMTLGGLNTFLEDLEIDFPEIETSFRFPEINLDDLDLAAYLESEDEGAVGEMIDKAEELNKKWQVERGQVFEIPSKSIPNKCHKIMCGDSTDAGDVALLLTENVPFLCVTDPPYGVNYDPGWRSKAAAEGHLAYAARRIGKVAHDDRSDWRATWELFPGDVIYSWHPAGATSLVHAAALQETGFVIRMQIIWAKSNFPIGRGDYHVRHEPCWYAVRKGKPSHRTKDRTQTTLWEINLDKNVTGATAHKNHLNAWRVLSAITKRLKFTIPSLAVAQL